MEDLYVTLLPPKPMVIFLLRRGNWGGKIPEENLCGSLLKESEKAVVRKRPHNLVSKEP